MTGRPENRPIATALQETNHQLEIIAGQLSVLNVHLRHVQEWLSQHNGAPAPRHVPVKYKSSKERQKDAAQKGWETRRRKIEGSLPAAVDPIPPW